MPSIQICAVSGTCRTPTGSALPGVTVKAYSNRPFIHPTDNSLIANYEVNTTTANDGTWSLNLVETTTPACSLTVAFYYPSNTLSGYDRREYTIIVPNQTSATFASLVTGEQP